MSSWSALEGPTTALVLLSFDALKRVRGLKGLEARAVDLALTTKAHVLAMAAGPHFRGVIGVLGREAYASTDGARM
jgi:hypothetical protein